MCPKSISSTPDSEPETARYPIVIPSEEDSPQADVCSELLAYRVMSSLLPKTEASRKPSNWSKSSFIKPKKMTKAETIQSKLQQLEFELQLKTHLTSINSTNQQLHQTQNISPHPQQEITKKSSRRSKSRQQKAANVSSVLQNISSSSTTLREGPISQHNTILPSLVSNNDSAKPSTSSSRKHASNLEIVPDSSLKVTVTPPESLFKGASKLAWPAQLTTDQLSSGVAPIMPKGLSNTQISKFLEWQYSKKECKMARINIKAHNARTQQQEVNGKVEARIVDCQDEELQEESLSNQKDENKLMDCESNSNNNQVTKRKRQREKKKRNEEKAKVKTTVVENEQIKTRKRKRNSNSKIESDCSHPQDAMTSKFLSPTAPPFQDVQSFEGGNSNKAKENASAVVSNGDLNDSILKDESKILTRQTATSTTEKNRKSLDRSNKNSRKQSGPSAVINSNPTFEDNPLNNANINSKCLNKNSNNNSDIKKEKLRDKKRTEDNALSSKNGNLVDNTLEKNNDDTKVKSRHKMR